MNDRFTFKLCGETAVMFNNLLDNLCEKFFLKKNEGKILLQKTIRDIDVLNLIADKLMETLATEEQKVSRDIIKGGLL